MLPPELLYTIIDQLHADALADKGAGEMAIYCLALTCRLFFRLTKNYVRVWSLGRTTRWMGGRLVCMGKRTRTKDLPGGMLRPEEHQHMLRSLDDPRRRYPTGRLGEKYADLTLIDHIAWRTVSVITWRKQVSASLSELQESTMRRLPREDAETLVDYLTPYYAPRDDWVLYNKDTREYVRARAVAELCGQPDAEQPFLATCAVNLGDVLLSRICWSSERPPNITVAGRVHEVHRGVWAGNRFRISTMERLGSLLGRDVSAEVVGEMEAVWKGWHGSEWGWPSMPAVSPWFRPDANE